MFYWIGRKFLNGRVRLARFICPEMARNSKKYVETQRAWIAFNLYSGNYESQITRFAKWYAGDPEMVKWINDYNNRYYK
jgi:hypothetical protein